MDQVFDRFESHPQGSRHRGAGLGLSIVRSFVELHGGTVESIPRRAGHDASPAASRSSAARSRRMRD